VLFFNMLENKNAYHQITDNLNKQHEKHKSCICKEIDSRSIIYRVYIYKAMSYLMLQIKVIV